MTKWIKCISILSNIIHAREQNTVQLLIILHVQPDYFSQNNLNMPIYISTPTKIHTMRICLHPSGGLILVLDLLLQRNKDEGLKTCCDQPHWLMNTVTNFEVRTEVHVLMLTNYGLHKNGKPLFHMMKVTYVT